MQTVSIETQKSRNRSKRFLRDTTIGAVVVTSYVACRAFKEENRADTFVKTAKNCLKDYTNYNRKQCSDLAKVLTLDNVAKWMSKVSNKKMCAALLAGDAIIDGLFLGAIWDWLTKKNSK